MAPEKTVKVIFFITKKPDISDEQFKSSYAAHNKTIAQIPNLLRYTQNVVSRVPVSPLPALPVTGVAELWFESVEAMAAGFESQKGQELWQIALKELAAFIQMESLQMSLVEENRVIN